MTIGEIVAERYKKQYYTKRGGWCLYKDWQIPPEKIYIILLELKSKAAVNALMQNDSWTRYIRQKNRGIT